MAHDDSTEPTILFGAFDRHNFGDLLFPHITAAMLGETHILFVGLAEKDLRCYGGHRVRGLAQLVEDRENFPAKIIHVGGEILSCDIWQAAVMLLPPDRAKKVIRYFDNRPEEKLEWARNQLGISFLAPYSLPPGLFNRESRIIYNAVGGVELNNCCNEMRAEIMANLKAANAVSVRDKQTLTQLEDAGIKALLVPDPAVMVAELFGKQIRQHANEGEVAQILTVFPRGYIAVQFSADFDNDVILKRIAAQLDQVSNSTGYGVVFFRAGAAPWHDDLLCYQRTVARMHTRSVRIATSLNLWDICALIAHCRIYCGSSLHGRIVAMAYALPRISLIHPGQLNQSTKQAAFATTWEDEDIPISVEVHEIAQGIRDTLSIDPDRYKQTAKKLKELYRSGFKEIYAELNK